MADPHHARDDVNPAKQRLQQVHRCPPVRAPLRRRVRLTAESLRAQDQAQNVQQQLGAHSILCQDDSGRPFAPLGGLRYSSLHPAYSPYRSPTMIYCIRRRPAVDARPHVAALARRRRARSAWPSRAYVAWQRAAAATRSRRRSPKRRRRRRGPPIFARWLQFEPEEVRANPAAADQLHRRGARPPGVPRAAARRAPADRAPAAARRRQAAAVVGPPPVDARARALQPGLAGEFCYAHSTYCLHRLFDVSFSVDGQPVVLYDNQYWIERYPSHTVVHYELAEGVDPGAQVHHLRRSRRGDLRHRLERQAAAHA